MPLSCSAARTQVHFFSTFSAFSTSRPTMLGSASVEVSPNWSASRHAIFRSTRRMILPAAERGGSWPAHSHIAFFWLRFFGCIHISRPTTPRNAPRHSPCVISPCHILSSQPPPALFLNLPPLLFPSSSSFPCLAKPTSVPPAPIPPPRHAQPSIFHLHPSTTIPLPERVFGKPGVQTMWSGVARPPIALRTACKETTTTGRFNSVGCVVCG